MKKISFLILLLSLVTIAACSTMPSIDPQLEGQVQIEASEFGTLLSRLVTHVSSIKNPSDADMRSVFPNSWLFEQTPQLYALGIPISKAIMRGLVPVRETDEWTYYLIPSPTEDWLLWSGSVFWGQPVPTIVYFNRGEKLNPNTDIYIVPTWIGQPYKWGNIEGGAPDKRDYPRELNLDYFKSDKIVKQPYMIPPEATYGVYQEPRDKLSGGNTSNLSGIVRQMWDANPYLDKSETERLKTPTISQLMAQLPAEIVKINWDVTICLDNINNLENKYFKTNSSIYGNQNELADYKNSLGKIKIELSQIEEYLQPIKKWDFRNLEKYRALKAR
jgi:hypothetical protein